MQKKVSINNAGIDSAGLPNNYMEAVSEYIWNGFDAKATEIRILFNSNVLDYISELSVCDNGEGIDLSMIDRTFGNFMDSLKRASFQKTSSAIRGNKGKGRFSFVAFSGEAVWTTTYFEKESKKLLDFSIIIRKDSKETFDFDNKTISKKERTGTTVTFKELFGVTAYSFSSEDFKKFLGREFGWFLLLNKDRGYQIFINEERLSYDYLIAESENWVLPIKNTNGDISNFKITFVRWSEKIGDRFYFYFLNSQQSEVGKELTSFNNNAINFNHSVYIESPFFDSFNANDKEQSLNIFENTKADGVYRVLMTHLHKMVKEKQKQFLNEIAAEELIENYEKTGVIPAFKKNKYEQARKKDLISVVKSIYCVEPRFFQGLNKEQQKVSVGLINLLLDTDQRDTIIELIGQIVTLTAGEREDLLKVLKKTTVAKITRTVALIENRFKVIELLRSLVFDLKKFTSEIKHLQKAIEESYWIFGEQYHLVSANESFEVLHKKYIDFISTLEANDKKKSKRLKSEESNRRPDVFICRKHTTSDVTDSQYMMEENVIVELKRPTVDIGKEQIRQIEDYLEIIRNDDAFNSQKRFWKFIIVGNRVDEYVLGQYEAVKEKNKKFLVKAVHNYEIYAYTWDDIFTLFNLRHQFLVENLEFDRNVIKKELIEKGINIFSPEQPDVIVLQTLAVADDRSTIV